MPVTFTLRNIYQRRPIARWWTGASTSFKPAGERADGEETAADGTISESNLDDDDDMENWLSVVAIEAELKPKVIETTGLLHGQ